MAQKLWINKKYFVKWRNHEAIKRTWGPFLFDVATGISERSFQQWDPKIIQMRSNPKYNKIFELIEVNEPRRQIVSSVDVRLPPVQTQTPLIEADAMKKKDYEEALQKMRDLQKEDSVFNDAPDVVVEEFHTKEKQKKRNSKRQKTLLDNDV